MSYFETKIIITRFIKSSTQGSKNVPSGCPGSGKQSGNCIKSLKEQNIRLTQGKQHLRDTCPKGKLDISSPEYSQDLKHSHASQLT